VHVRREPVISVSRFSGVVARTSALPSLAGSRTRMIAMPPAPSGRRLLRIDDANRVRSLSLAVRCVVICMTMSSCAQQSGDAWLEDQSRLFGVTPPMLVGPELGRGWASRRRAG